MTWRGLCRHSAGQRYQTIGDGGNAPYAYYWRLNWNRTAAATCANVTARLTYSMPPRISRALATRGAADNAARLTPRATTTIAARIGDMIYLGGDMIPAG